jgi:hypothetical protein
MKRLVLVTVVAACGSKESPPKQPQNVVPAASATGGYATLEATVKAFNASLESGDGTAIRAQFPSEAAFASHVVPECAEAFMKMFDEWPIELLKIDDIKAMQGRHAEFVKLEQTKSFDVAAGDDVEGCKFTKPVGFVKISSTWSLEGESHKLALMVVQLDGRYYAFDLPGL